MKIFHIFVALSVILLLTGMTTEVDMSYKIKFTLSRVGTMVNYSSYRYDIGRSTHHSSVLNNKR